MIRSLAVAALACALAATAAHAQKALPTCTELVPALKRDRETVRDSLPVLSVEAIVEDLKSTPDARLCTGVARYADDRRHYTFSARWRDARQTAYTVEGHETVPYEAAARAQSLRARLHPKG